MYSSPPAIQPTIGASARPRPITSRFIPLQSLTRPRRRATIVLRAESVRLGAAERGRSYGLASPANSHRGLTQMATGSF
jgi:hypothetical protein